MSDADECSSEEKGFDFVKNSNEGSDLENEEFNDESLISNQNKPLKRKLDSKGDSNKRIKRNKDLYKPPTTEELNRLQENENLFNSNLFRLQIEELLNEVKIKHRYVAIFESWYEKFQTFIKTIPEYDFENTKTPNKSKKNNEIRYTSLEEIENNLCGSCCKSDYSKVTAFIRPYNVDIFGKYRINAVVGTNLEVDIKLIIPKPYFRERDYLNNRYWIKYNYYASYIATELKKANLCSRIAYLLEHNNVLLSTLIVTPSESDKITVKIHVVPQENTFKNYRFEPEKNNVKFNIFQDNFDINMETLKITATPFYNAAIAKNCVLESNYNFLEDNLRELKNVQDGIKLLTVWLKQRFAFNNPVGFTEELLLFVMLYLVIKKRVNKHMSSYQIIRNFWYFLSSTDWSEDPISLSGDVKDEQFKQYRKQFDIVFLDKSGYYNLTSFLDKNIYIKIKKESQIAVNLLDKVQFNSFGALFMSRMPYQVQYDAIVIIKSENQFSELFKFIPEEKKINYTHFYELLLQKTITSFLQKGLGKRIKNLVPQCIEGFIKDVGSKAQPELDKLIFGITLDPEHAYKIVEIGPSADDKEAALEFQNFWGNLAHCRRFNDGSIHEAVHFEAETFQEKRNIFKKIVNFVLSEKLQLKDNYIFCDELEKFISPCGKSTTEEPTLKVITVFDELTKLLRSLTLPLDITAIYGKSEVFCYSDLFPPIPTAHKPETDVTTLQSDNIVFKENVDVKWIPNYCAPIECVIHLSLHSKWPNDLEAFKHIKTAFYLKISDLLKEKNKVKSNVRPEFFDVYYKGYVFRFALHHPKEIKFLKEKVDTTTGVISYKDTEESIHYEKELDVACKINGALNGIQSQFSSFGPSNTLIKRWLRSQLIDNFYIPDIVIDLLNASIYLNNINLSNSNLPQVQFLRFLKFIQDSDWNLNAVVVNFNDEITREQLDSYETSFHQNRQSYPPLYIITPYDNGKSLFTINTCSKEVLRRLAILAAATYNALIDNFLQAFEGQLLKSIFLPNMDGYNVLIHLKPSLNSRRYESIEYNRKYFKNIRTKNVATKYEKSAIPIVGFNPVDLYLSELRVNYGEFAYFFHDTYGGCKIAVLWKPNIFDEKEFKINCVNAHKLTNNKLMFNEEAVIEDFYIIGEGLVENIEKK